MSRIARTSIWLAVLMLIAGAVMLGLYSGVYNVAADDPHSRPMLALLEFVRERSIVARANGIQVPGDLLDAKRIGAGAVLYNEMCSGCHLAPEMEPTEISKGLYPAPPNLSNQHDDHEMTAARQFWIIKHGIKMTAMPAWGVAHSDELIWDMVAFLRRLPSLSAADYRMMTKEASQGQKQQAR